MSKQDVTFTPYSKGDLLAEIVRAYTHSATPSCVILKVICGLEAAQVEITNPTDRAFTGEVIMLLEDLRRRIHTAELALYA